MARTETKPASIRVEGDDPEQVSALGAIVAEALLGYGVGFVVENYYKAEGVCIEPTSDTGEIETPVNLELTISYDSPVIAERKAERERKAQEAEEDERREAERETAKPPEEDLSDAEAVASDHDGGSIAKPASQDLGDHQRLNVEPKCDKANAEDPNHKWEYDPFAEDGETDAHCQACGARADWSKVGSG